MKAFTIIATILSIVALTGVAGYYIVRREARYLSEYSTKIVRAKVNKLNTSRVDVDLWLLLENKSIFSFELVNYNLEIFVNDKYLNTLTSDKIILIKALSESEVSLNINFEPINLYKILYANIGTLLNKNWTEKIMIRIEGTLTVKPFGLFSLSDLPIAIEDTLHNFITEEKQEV